MSKLKHFKEFETYSDYKTYINGNPILPNVSFVSQDVYYKDGEPTPPIPSIISVGMICYADSNNKLKFISKDEWDSSLGTAQGVVVVPSNHTPDGTARIICITGITTAGTESSSDVSMIWGEIGVDTGLPNMRKVPTWDNTIGGTIGNSDFGCLPSNNENGNFTGVTCVCDSLTKYPGFTPFIPSPYLEDGSQNPAYINTVEATTGNCLSDFDGKSNTSVLVGLGNNYVAANACNQYGTIALPSGNWYLPACGELGYIIPRFNEINLSLQKVGGIQLGSGNFYWSSAEFGSGYACVVDTYFGSVTSTSKNQNPYVRAFASVPIE